MNRTPWDHPLADITPTEPEGAVDAMFCPWCDLALDLHPWPKDDNDKGCDLIPRPVALANRRQLIVDMAEVR